MQIAIASFLAAFGFVALKSWQQLNVVHEIWWLIVPTSVAMAVCEVYVVANIARLGWDIPLVLAVGFGSGLGCISSMALHKRMRGRK